MFGTDGNAGKNGMPAADNEEMDEVLLFIGRLGSSELPTGIRLLEVHKDLDDGQTSIVWHPSNPLDKILLAIAPMGTFSGGCI